MDKQELEGLLENENNFVEYVHQLDQQKGGQVFDAFISALLDLGNPTLLKQLLQIYASCVVSIAKMLGLVSADVEPKSEANQDLLMSAERKRQRTLSMEAFMIRFYEFRSETSNEKPTLGLAEFASLETGEYWTQDVEEQKKIKAFLKQCQLFLSRELAKIAKDYLQEIEKHESMNPLQPRDTAVLLCVQHIGAITLPKDTTGVVIEILNEPDVSFLVDKKRPTDNDLFVRINKKYLHVLQPKLDVDMFDLAPHEVIVVKKLTMEMLNKRTSEDITWAIQSAQAKHLLLPMLYEALSLNIKETDKTVRSFLKKHSDAEVQDAFQTACVRLLIDSHGARPT